MPPKRRRPSTRSQQNVIPYTRSDLNGKYRVCTSCGCNIEFYNYLNVTCTEDFPTCIDCRLTEDVRGILAKVDEKGEAFTAELKARIIDEQTTKLDTWSTTMIKHPAIELVPSSEAIYWAQDGFRRLLDEREKAATANNTHDVEMVGTNAPDPSVTNGNRLPASTDIDHVSEPDEPVAYYLRPPTGTPDQVPEGDVVSPYIPPADAEEILATVKTMLELMEQITTPGQPPTDTEELKTTFKDHAGQLWLSQLDYDIMTVRAERDKQTDRLDALDRWVQAVLDV